MLRSGGEPGDQTDRERCRCCRRPHPANRSPASSDWWSEFDLDALGLLKAADVLVDERVSVEIQVGRVAAQERLAVAAGRQLIKPFLFKRAQIAFTHLRRLLHLSQLEPAPLTRIPQALTDLEHRSFPLGTN